MLKYFDFRFTLIVDFVWVHSSSTSAPCHSSYVSRPPPDSYFSSWHIFNIVSTAILSILLILLAVLTFVLSGSANIPVRALIKCFLSMSYLLTHQNLPVLGLSTTLGSQKHPLFNWCLYFSPASIIQVPY